MKGMSIFGRSMVGTGPWRRAAAGSIVALALLQPLAAQTPGSVVPPADEAGYVTGSLAGDIWMGNLGSFWGTFAGLGLSFATQGILSGSEDFGHFERAVGGAVTELSTIPLALSGSPDTLGLAVFGAGLLTAETLSNIEYGADSALSNSLYWARNNLTMYRAYDAYASFRLRSAAWDNTEFQRHSFAELAAAPFSAENFTKPHVYLGFLSGVVFNLVYELYEPEPFSATVWNTGETWVGDRRLGMAGFLLESVFLPLLNFPIGAAGEESVFRGYMHEELTIRVGEPWATVIGTGAFMLMHIVTDIVRQQSPLFIATHAIQVGIMNLLFIDAYRQGGLPLAVASHTFSNVGYNYMYSLVRGGAPQE